MRHLRSDDRGASTQIGYVLSVAIATILISVLISSVVGFVADTQDDVAEQELKVTGERLAAQLQAADSAARTDSSARIVMNTDAPAKVAGKRYTVKLNTGPTPSDDYLVLTTNNREQRVVVQLRLQTSATDATVASGDLNIVHPSGGDITIERES